MTLKKPKPKPKPKPKTQTANQESISAGSPKPPSKKAHSPMVKNNTNTKRSEPKKRLRDVTGIAAFYLPSKLRKILGEQTYELQFDGLSNTELYLIVRTAKDVVYVNLPILVEDLPSDIEAIIEAAKLVQSEALKSADGADGAEKHL